MRCSRTPRLSIRDARGLRRDVARLRKANARTLVALERAKVIALATLYFVPVLHEDGRWCRLTALVVDGRHRRAGVATALVRRAEALARAAGCGRIEATSRKRRRSAHDFYARLG